MFKEENYCISACLNKSIQTENGISNPTLHFSHKNKLLRGTNAPLSLVFSNQTLNKTIVIAAITLLSLFLAFLIFAPTKAYADDVNLDRGAYSQPNEDIKKNTAERMIKVTADDISSFEGVNKWLESKESYIWVRLPDESQDKSQKPSYFFNVPNLQQNVYNFVQRLNTGGWTQDTNSQGYATDDSEQWTTAEKKYGYSLPKSYYTGETPVVLLDVGNALKGVTNPLGGIGVTISLARNALNDSILRLFTGDSDFDLQLVGFTPDKIQNVYYVNQDYHNSSLDYNKEMSKYVERNYETWKENKDELGIKTDSGQNIFDDNVIVGSGETVSDKDQIGSISGGTFLNRLIEKVGNKYSLILARIGEFTKKKTGEEIPKDVTIRHMPYDITNMDPASQEYMNGVVDQRVVMAGKDGFYNFVSNAFKDISNFMAQTFVIGFTGLLMNFSAMLNSICDLGFVESLGVHLYSLWEGPIGKFIFFVVIIATIIACLKVVISLLTGSKEGQSIKKLISTALIALVVLSLLLVPRQLCSLITNTASNVMNITTQALDLSGKFTELHISGAETKDKSSLRFWYMYYSTWTQYATNHALNDEANDFSRMQNTNEYYQYSNPAKLKGNFEINQWPAIMIDELQKGNMQDIYRASDHYMAPDVQDGEFPNFTVTQNKFFNGNMFSEVPIGAPLGALAVAGITILKVLCFIEFIVDTMLLFVRIAIELFDSKNKEILNLIKSALTDIFRVIVYDMMITLFIYSCTVVKGALGSLIISILLAIITAYLYYTFYKNPNKLSILCPSLFTMITSAVRVEKDRVKELISEEKLEKENVGDVDRVQEIFKDTGGALKYYGDTKSSLGEGDIPSNLRFNSKSNLNENGMTNSEYFDYSQEMDRKNKEQGLRRDSRNVANWTKDKFSFMNKEGKNEDDTQENEDNTSVNSENRNNAKADNKSNRFKIKNYFSRNSDNKDNIGDNERPIDPRFSNTTNEVDSGRHSQQTPETANRQNPHINIKVNEKAENIGTTRNKPMQTISHSSRREQLDNDNGMFSNVNEGIGERNNNTQQIKQKNEHEHPARKNLNLGNRKPTSNNNLNNQPTTKTDQANSNNRNKLSNLNIKDKNKFNEGGEENV